MAYLIQCEFCASENNNYLLAGNLCNAFAIGDLGSTDDFFLVGSEPDGESSYPLLTGNILDSEGNVLFRLVRNILVVNPGNCSKIVGGLCDYEIHDSAGEPIFSIKTKFEPPPNSTREMFLTTIKGTFYNKNGEVVFRANSGEPGEHIESSVKCLLGLPGGMCHGYSEEELEFVKVVLATHGRIQRPLTGTIQNQEITLDGMALIDTELRGCTIHVHNGNFAFLHDPHFYDCTFLFHGDAENIWRLTRALGNQQTTAPGEEEGEDESRQSDPQK